MHRWGPPQHYTPCPTPATGGSPPPAAGILLNSQFSSNYFAISQVEQNFPDFAAAFAGAPAEAGGAHQHARLRARQQPARA